jgi:hypothetical protein
LFFVAGAAAVALGLGVPAFAQTPALQPFVGAWRLNIPKSHMGFDGPEVVTPMRGPGFTWIFTAKPYGLQQDVYDSYPAPAATRTVEVITDGRPKPCKTVQSCLPGGGDPKDQTIAYYRLDDHMMARISYVKGQVLEYDSYSISEDGQTFVVTAWKAPHPEWQNVQVFDQQPR